MVLCCGCGCIIGENRSFFKNPMLRQRVLIILKTICVLVFLEAISRARLPPLLRGIPPQYSSSVAPCQCAPMDILNLLQTRAEILPLLSPRHTAFSPHSLYHQTYP